VLNATTIPELRCWAVAGAANNQLASPEGGQLLADAGILYAPDFVVNAGGLINVAAELESGGYDAGRAAAQVAGIEGVMAAIIAEADAAGTTPLEAAKARAQLRLAAA